MADFLADDFLARGPGRPFKTDILGLLSWAFLATTFLWALATLGAAAFFATARAKENKD